MSDQVIGMSKLLTMPGYVHRVSVGNTGAFVRISNEDDSLVQAYCKQYGKPRPTIIHLMIGQAAICWEDKHDERLKEIVQRMEVILAKLAAAEHILSLYEERYGTLPALRRYKELGKQ